MPKITECPEGKIPTLSAENSEIWALFRLMLPGLVHQGGYDYNAIQVILDIHGIPAGRRPGMISKIITLIGVVDKERANRDK